MDKDYYWHGTTTVFAKDILKHGIIPDAEDRVWVDYPQHAYLTTNAKKAVNWADLAVEAYGGAPVVIAVKFNRKRTDQTVEWIHIYYALMPRGTNVTQLARQPMNKTVDDAIKRLIKTFPACARIINKAQQPLKKIIEVFITFIIHHPSLKNIHRAESLADTVAQVLRHCSTKGEKRSLSMDKPITFRGKTRIVLVAVVKPFKILYKDKQGYGDEALIELKHHI